MRGGPRDFLYSKLMCWVALDCAIELADTLHAHDRIDAWAATRERIRDAILKRGWSEKAGAFTQAFGSDDLDASALLMPIVGFLPATDPRMWATIDAIAERLTDAHGLVYRYRACDGLAGEEGTFLLCTFWLAHALALAGEVERARVTFERSVAYVNGVGLLAEEVDPATGELLGIGVQRFVYTSTTSLYGFALVPREAAVWVTEALTPRPRDIYDITKIAAEDLCQHFALSQGLPTICLRTARFFPQAPQWWQEPSWQT